MNSFQSELQDLITRWLMKGDDPTSMHGVMAEYQHDLLRMAAMKARAEGTLPASADDAGGASSE